MSKVICEDEVLLTFDEVRNTYSISSIGYILLSVIKSSNIEKLSPLSNREKEIKNKILELKEIVEKDV